MMAYMGSLSRTSIFVGGFMAGFVLAAAWFLTPDASQILESKTGAEPRANAGERTPYRTSSALVSVETQQAGETVLVAAVNVAAPGVWVAVQEVAGNELGNVLGAARAREPVSNLSIPLLRKTEAGKTYVITLYRDDGDGLFSTVTDSVYIDFESGERVAVAFKTLP